MATRNIPARIVQGVDAMPLYASSGWVRNAFGLTCSDLATLRGQGEIYAVKRTDKCWLYRVPDIVRWLGRGADAVKRDALYAEDLAWIEEHSKTINAKIRTRGPMKGGTQNDGEQ